MSRIILNITGAIVVEKNTNNTDIETKDSHHTNSEQTKYIECGTTLNKRKQKERTPKRKRVSRMPEVNYPSLPQCPEPEPGTSDGEPRPVARQPGQAPVDTQTQPALVCLHQRGCSHIFVHPPNQQHEWRQRLMIVKSVSIQRFRLLRIVQSTAPCWWYLNRRRWSELATAWARTHCACADWLPPTGSEDTGTAGTGCGEVSQGSLRYHQWIKLCLREWCSIIPPPPPCSWK